MYKYVLVQLLSSSCQAHYQYQLLLPEIYKSVHPIYPHPTSATPILLIPSNNRSPNQTNAPPNPNHPLPPRSPPHPQHHHRPPQPRRSPQPRPHQARLSLERLQVPVRVQRGLLRWLSRRRGTEPGEGRCGLGQRRGDESCLSV